MHTIDAPTLEEALAAARHLEGSAIVRTPFGSCLAVSIPWHADRATGRYRRMNYPITPGGSGPHSSEAIRAAYCDPREKIQSTNVEDAFREARALGATHVWSRCGQVLPLPAPSSPPPDAGKPCASK